jgi:hypothetical protein
LRPFANDFIVNVIGDMKNFSESSNFKFTDEFIIYYTCYFKSSAVIIH